MVSSIYRSSITEHLLIKLRAEGFPVGDVNTPDIAYGWQAPTDQANAEDAEFIPWMVLRPGRIDVPTGAMGDSATEYRMFYSIDFAGVHRVQTDWIADKMRNALVNAQRETVVASEGNWRIQQIRCTAIGGITRITSSFPDYYVQTDNFELWVSRERS